MPFSFRPLSSSEISRDCLFVIFLLVLNLCLAILQGLILNLEALSPLLPKELQPQAFVNTVFSSFVILCKQNGFGVNKYFYIRS